MKRTKEIYGSQKEEIIANPILSDLNYEGDKDINSKDNLSDAGDAEISELDQDSDFSGEKATYEAGKGVTILDCIEDEMRNIDDVVEESCQIGKPSFVERGRALCNNFAYFDKYLDVYTDEEDVIKTISGYN